MGDPKAKDTNVGALISKEHLAKVLLPEHILLCFM